MMRTAALFVGVVVIGSSCSSGEGREWADIGQAADLGGVAEIVEGDTVHDRGGIRVIEATTGEQAPCAQVVVDGAAWFCDHVDMGTGRGGHTSQALRVGDERFIELRSSASVREFRVWSTVTPRGRAVEPIHADGSSILVWRMEPDEAPWGVQIVEADGTLGSAVSFVGLPAD